MAAAAADLEKNQARAGPVKTEEPANCANNRRIVAGVIAAVLGIAVVVAIVVVIWADGKDDSSDDAAVQDVYEEPDAHVISPWSCNISNLSFTETVYNNLRGLGPDTNSPEGLRFKNVHTFDNDTSVDLIITLVSSTFYSVSFFSSYKAEDEVLNGACDGFGCIHTLIPSNHLYSFQFVESITSKPTSLTEFRFLFFNEDDDFTVKASVELVNRSKYTATWVPTPESAPFLKHSRYFNIPLHYPTSRFLLELDVTSNITLTEPDQRSFSFMGMAASSFGREKCRD